MTKKHQRKPEGKASVPAAVSPVYYASGNFAVAAVETSMAALRAHFQDDRRVQEWYCDVHVGSVRPAVPRQYLDDYALFVGLADCAWLLAKIPWWRNSAALLSRDFATRAVSLEYEDTGDTLSYRLFDHGEQREEYVHCLQEQTSGFESTWRPGLRPGDDEHRFIDDTFHELGLRLPYAWLEPLTNGRLYGRTGFDLDFSGETVRAERPVPTMPLPRVPGEIPPEVISGFDAAVF